jgi:hypothetical protein
MSSNKFHKLKEAYNFLSDINRIAYADVRLLANQVLSKNPFATDFVDNFIEGLPVKPINSFVILLNLVKYYISSCRCFVIFMANKIIFHLFCPQFDLQNTPKSIVIIDTFFLLDKIEADHKFHDHCFPGLEDILIKRKMRFAYVPTFCPTPSPLRLFKVLNKFKSEELSILTEYELISSKELAILFWLTISYPFHVIGFALSLPCDTYKENLLKNELLKSVGNASFNALARYLQGVRISSFPNVDMKVISWYENQVTHKSFYKGLRSGCNQVKIYGAQLFIYPTSILNILVDPTEASHGILPDKVIVNGSYYVRDDINVPMVSGPSLRYKRVFDSLPRSSARDNLLVLLPYHHYEIVNLLNAVSLIDWAPTRILIKFHPSVKPDKYIMQIPEGIKVVESDVYDLFPEAKIIISAESGALIEGACLGIPCVIVQNSKRFTHNPFPEEGKYIIWDVAHDISELNSIIKQFTQRFETRPAEIMKFADYYKSIFFTEVTEDGVINAFDLD